MKQSGEKKALEAADREDYRYGSYDFIVQRVMYNTLSVDPLASDMMYAIFHARVVEEYEKITKIVQVKNLFVEGINNKLIKNYHHDIVLLFDKTAPVGTPFLLGAVYKFNALDFEENDNFYNFPFSINEFAQSEDFEFLTTLLPHFDFKTDPRYTKLETPNEQFIRLAAFIIPDDKVIQERLYDEIMVKQLYKQTEMLSRIINICKNESKEARDENLVLGDNI